MTDSLLLLRNAEIFFLPVDYLCFYKGYMYESSFITSWLHFKSGSLYPFHFSPFWSIYFSESITDQVSCHYFFCLFVWNLFCLFEFLCARKDLFWKSCPTWREREQVAVVSYWGDRNIEEGSQASSILKFISCQGCKQWRLSQSDELM